MYGTIFKLQVKPGHEQALLSLLKDQTPPDGAVAWFVMKPDDNDGEMVGVAVFENKEAQLEVIKESINELNILSIYIKKSILILILFIY